MFKLKLKHFMTFILAVILLLSVALADESNTECIYMPDISDGTKSLTVYYEFNESGIDGAKISIYKFADINVHNGRVEYSLTDDFSNLDVDFTTLTAKQSVEIAKKIDLSGKKALKSSTTNSKGEVKFTNLESGLYLIVETGKSGTAAEYEFFDSFIMAVPYAEYDYTITDDTGNYTGEWTDNVVCYPKTETVKIPIPPHTPETGDEMNLAVLIIAAIVSLSFIIIGVKKNKGKITD